MESEELEKKSKFIFISKVDGWLFYLTDSERPRYRFYSTMDFIAALAYIFLWDAALSFMFLHILLVLNAATDDQVLHIYFSL